MSLKRCRECGVEVSSEAPTCPKCGVKNPVRKRGRVLVVVASLALFLVVVANMGGGDKQSGTSAASAAPRAAQPPIEVSNAQLWKEYDANEVAADERYKDRSLLVSGSIESIDKDAFGNMVLHLKSPEMFANTMATLDDSQKANAMQLAKGQAVKVQCRGAGKILRSPNLRDCVLR